MRQPERTTEAVLPWIPVRGASMWPALRAGDALELVPLDGPVSPGDVVLARMAPGLVAHRVLAVSADRVLLQGDACPSPDGWVARAQLVGRAGRVRRRARVLSRSAWDRGPRWLGRVRLAAGRSVQRLLRRGA